MRKKRVKQSDSIDLKKVDILVLIALPAIATILSLLFRTNFLISTLLFFGISAVYLAIRNAHAVGKSLLFSIFMGLFAAFVVDYFATINGSWFIPSTLFSFRLLNVVPVEDMIWGFLLVFNIIMFYEHFLDKGKHALKDTNFKYFVVLVILILFLFFSIYIFKPELFMINYFYVKFGLSLILLPTLTFIGIFPRLLSKYIKTGAYFFAQGIMFELTALHLGQWEFKNTDYIGWVEVNSLRFPLEEFVFWLVLFAVCILSYYEFFYDDMK